MRLGTGLGLTNLNLKDPAVVSVGDITITKLLLHLDSDFSDSSIYTRFRLLKDRPLSTMLKKSLVRVRCPRRIVELLHFPKAPIGI